MVQVQLEQAVGQYVEDVRRRGCSAAHIGTVSHRLSRFARGRESCPVRALTDEELSAYFTAMREAGLADGTLAGHRQTLMAFLRFCQRRRWCSAKLVEALKTRQHRYSFKPVHSRAAPAVDFAAVISSLMRFAAHRNWKPRDVRDAALVSLVADSGRRRGEVWNLRRIDLIRALARPEPLEASGRSVYHVESHGKTGQVLIRFYDESAELLRRWVELLPDGAVYVFVNLRTGQRLRADALHLGLIRICQFVGAKPFRFHAMRKRVVTDVIGASGDAKVGQLLAGHASERTTQLYYNDVREAAVDAAAAKLQDKYRGGEGENQLASAFFGLC